MTDKINLKELESIVANIVNELGVNDVFNEEMNKKIQEKIKGQLQNPVVSEAEINNEAINLEKDPNPIAPAPTESDLVEPIVDPLPISVEPDIEQQLPNFIQKAEPGQIFVFDYNELSFGGENLSNKKFRQLSNPDEKRSIHDMWLSDGKIKADVFIVKFEKLGEIKFNPFNTTSKFEEKRFDPNLNNIAQPFNQNSNEPIVKDDQDINPVVNKDVADNELEAKIYDIVLKMLKGNLHTPTGPIGVNINAISASQVKNNEFDNTLNKVQKDVKMIDLVNGFEKINTPDAIKESLEGKTSKASLINKNEEVQIWLFEGEKYYLPTNIISNRKCYVSK